jgi:hypothetical protein
MIEVMMARLTDRSGRRLGLALVFWCLGSGLAQAESQAAKIAITATSPRGAIIIKSAELPSPPTYSTAYRLFVQRYDPAGQQVLSGGLLGGGAIIAARPKLFTDGFLVADLPPGTYVIHSFSRQDFWILCYQDSTLQFTIRAGEVLYLGEFAAALALVEVTRQAVTSHRTSTKGSPVDFFDNVPAPFFDPGDDTALAAAATMAKRSMPGTNVVPTPVTFAPARFGTGSTLFGGRRCGGYFQGKAK